MTHRNRLAPNSRLLLLLTGLLSFSIAAAQPGKDAGPQALDEVVNPHEHVRYSFSPNDTYFDQQWHLAETSVHPDVEINVNVEPVWERGITGEGVTIGIIDDSLQHTHPDLSPNYVPADSYDFGEDDGDPSPVDANDRHGTAVAGVAAARGGNGLGITGAAPRANLAGLRVDFDNQSAADFADATTFHSSGNNTNIHIKNHSFGVISPYAFSNQQATALETSTAAGTIHVVAGGNERAIHSFFIDINDNKEFDVDRDPPVDADANKKHLQSVQETITISALGADGQFANYSNWGANLFATAPSRDAGQPAIFTTDRTGVDGYNTNVSQFNGDYTAGFGGTSASAPLAAGVIALGKEVNPDLDERMTKHLLAHTSRIVDADDSSVTSDGGWKTNGAGFAFNQNYGFGLIDADAFTRAAGWVIEMTPLTTETTGTVAVNAPIPDAQTDNVEPGTLTRDFTLSTGGELEEMEITLDIDHSWRGDLQATLTSPAGTSSRLMYRNFADSFDHINDWTFVSNAFWGENPVGEWTLTIEDWFAQDTGTWNSYSVLAKTGSIAIIPEPATLAVLTLAGLSMRRRRRAA